MLLPTNPILNGLRATTFTGNEKTSNRKKKFIFFPLEVFIAPGRPFWYGALPNPVIFKYSRKYLKYLLYEEYYHYLYRSTLFIHKSGNADILNSNLPGGRINNRSTNLLIPAFAVSTFIYSTRFIFQSDPPIVSTTFWTFLFSFFVCHLLGVEFL